MDRTASPILRPLLINPSFLRRREKFIPKIRMGQTDHGYHSFLQVLAEQVDYAIFSGDVLDAAARHNHRLMLHERDDIALFAIRCCGRAA